MVVVTECQVKMQIEIQYDVFIDLLEFTHEPYSAVDTWLVPI